MKSMRPPSAAIFFMTYFYRAGGGAMAPCRPPHPHPPPTGSATDIALNWKKNTGRGVDAPKFVNGYDFLSTIENNSVCSFPIFSFCNPTGSVVTLVFQNRRMIISFLIPQRNPSHEQLSSFDCEEYIHCVCIFHCLLPCSQGVVYLT